MKCEVCGNDYDKAFTVEMAGETHTFDSFECAIHTLAPVCGHCGCRIVGKRLQVMELPITLLFMASHLRDRDTQRCIHFNPAVRSILI